MSYLSRNEYTGDGSTTDYTVGFPYLTITHVKVYVDNVLQTITTDYSWVNSTTIRFVTAPATNLKVSIRRDTSSAARLVDYVSGSSLNEADLDTDSLQAFYLSQESVDRASVTNFSGRELLTAARTYYVRTDGSDSNDGLANTADRAFLTIQKALDVVLKTIDLGGYDVTIQVGNGTYTAGANMLHATVGDGYLTIQGDITTPSNVVISPTNITAFFVEDGQVTINGFKFTMLGASCAALYASGSGAVIFAGYNEYHSGNDFGFITADSGAFISIGGNNTISGGAVSFVNANSNAVIFNFGGTNTLIGTPAFTGAFVDMAVGACIYSSTTWVGSATGVRYSVSEGGIIFGPPSETYFPGSTPGIVATGGHYTGRPSREVLPANRTYYVRTDGSDSNTGRANTAADAFLTLQHAVDYVQSKIDTSIYDVTIQVGAGTYTAGARVTGPFVGSGTVHLVGDTTTPSNVVISVAGGDGISAYAGANLSVSGFKLVVSGTALYATGGSQITVEGKMEFGASGWHIYVDHLSCIYIANCTYTISGGASGHLGADTNSTIAANNVTVTLTGTPAFSSVFAYTETCGIIIATGSFSGAATGARYSSNSNGVIDVLGGGATFLPGNSAGSTSTGGQYV